MRRPLSMLIAAALLASANAATASPEPGITIFHVGYDNSPLVYYGPYTGLANPNYQRLTFLLSHTFEDNATVNHFHPIGAYSYSGDPLSPAPGFSGNNKVPEPYQADDGLTLLEGAGAFAGKLISGLGPDAFPGDEIEQEYGDITIAPIDDLFQYDEAADPDGEYDYHPGHYLLHANGGAYTESVADVTVGLKLVGISAGLTIHDQSGAVLMDAVDDLLTLGPGASWEFNPVFAVDAGAAPGSTYEATFILQDLSASPSWGDSAEFSFVFTTVPEPSAAVLVLTALAGLVPRRR